MISAFRSLVRQVHTENFSIHRATSADRDDVLRLMQEGFYKTDPSVTYSGVAENPSVSTPVQNMTVEPLEQEVSFMVRAKEEDDGIVGVIINGVRPTVLDDCYMKAFLKTIECEKERSLLEFWRFLSMMPQNSQRFFGEEEQVFEFRYMAVDQKFKNRGIATSLVKCSWREAKDKGFKYVRVDCTSSFTARIAASLGFRCIFSINYEDYKDSEKRSVFKNITPPHTRAQIYIGESEAC